MRLMHFEIPAMTVSDERCDTISSFFLNHINLPWQKNQILKKVKTLKILKSLVYLALGASTVFPELTKIPVAISSFSCVESLPKVPEDILEPSKAPCDSVSSLIAPSSWTHVQYCHTDESIWVPAKAWHLTSPTLEIEMKQ